MTQETAEPAVIPEQVADTSVAAPVDTTTQADAPDTSETVAETEEQKAERIVREREVRRTREQRKLNQRFSEITSERDAYKLALEIMRNGGGQQQQPAQAQSSDDPEPKEADYQDWSKWQRDLARWEARQEFRSLTKAQQERQEQASQQQSQQRQMAEALGTFEQRREAYAKTDPEYDTAVEALEQVPMGPHNAAMVEAILHHPDSPKILKFLGRNLPEADRISRLHPVLQAAAVGEIAAALRSTSPQVSKAPPPGVPVAGRGAANAQPRNASEYFDQITKGRHKR